jgi:DNA-binding transcriptional regulator YiaG
MVFSDDNDAIRKNWGYQMTPAQSRAARALLDWSQTDLALRAGLSVSTVADFEKGRREPSQMAKTAMFAAIHDAGVQLIDDGHSLDIGGEGVRFAHPGPAKQMMMELNELEESLESIELDIRGWNNAIKHQDSLHPDALLSLKEMREYSRQERTRLRWRIRQLKRALGITDMPTK